MTRMRLRSRLAIDASEVRWGAAGLVILGSALVVATVAKPSHGYRAAMPLLGALGSGAAGAALMLGSLTLVTATLRRRRGTDVTRPGTTAPSYPVLGASVGVLALVVVVASVWPTQPARLSDSNTRTAFQSWQPQTVPLALRYAADVRVLATLLRARRTSASISTIRIRRVQVSLGRLKRAVAVQQRRYNQTKALARIIPRFQHAIGLAVQSSVLLRLAGKAGVSRSVMVTARRRARAALTRSQVEMQGFVYESNFLGMQLSGAGR